MSTMASVSADNEWSPLKSAIVVWAARSNSPNEPRRMIENVMPEEYIGLIRPDNPFPNIICQRADAESDQLSSILEREGIKVYRPKNVDWQQIGGYTGVTGSMPQDVLITVGNRIIESPFA
ncbi:MAG: hypothetical protein Q9173_003375 [Seirophora scorigena]